jgi:hypothetical protein
MTDTNDLDPTSGVSRRRILARGAVLGGVVWAAPAVTTVGGSAFGQVAGSPPPGDTRISYIALNVTCGGSNFFIKYDQDADDFESSPSAVPFCESVITPNATSADGDDLGFTASAPDANGCITITVPAGCTVTASAVKGSTNCCAGATGTGALVFCDDCLFP